MCGSPNRPDKRTAAIYAKSVDSCSEVSDAANELTQEVDAWFSNTTAAPLVRACHQAVSERGALSTQDFTDAVIGNLGQKPKGDYTPCYLEDDYRSLLPAPE